MTDIIAFDPEMVVETDDGAVGRVIETDDETNGVHIDHAYASLTFWENAENVTPKNGGGA